MGKLEELKIRCQKSAALWNMSKSTAVGTVVGKSGHSRDERIFQPDF